MEGLLGDRVVEYGKELYEGFALIDVGESIKLLARLKDSLDINVKQTFIDPLHLLQDTDLRDWAPPEKPGEAATWIVIIKKLVGGHSALKLVMSLATKDKESLRSIQPQASRKGTRRVIRSSQKH
ncbi:Endophilin-A3 [Fukomys damarensis]|uniref:Endophilin-A3 n=1 Tax=Fukomys damarensis TaxID=885580 RepID=A0A091D7W1_FUKDA|nr:Endophilin-A3 [Fukomys damarensis]